MRLLDEVPKLFGDRVEPPFALRDLRLVDLRSLAFLALQLQLLAELLEPLRADPPEMTQLEVDHGIGRGERVSQQSLEPFELLLSPNDRAFLLLELVEELEPFLAQRAQLALHARPIPVQLQQLLGSRLVVALQQSSQHGRFRIL